MTAAPTAIKWGTEGNWRLCVDEDICVQLKFVLMGDQRAIARLRWQWGRCGQPRIEQLTTAISGWREKSLYVDTRTTAIPLHGFVRRDGDPQNEPSLRIALD